MSTLVVDIETIGNDWNSLSVASQLSLTKWINKQEGATDEVVGRQLTEVKSRLSLSPFTAKIVSLAMFDIERNIGAVYFSSGAEDDSFKSDSFLYKSRSEKEILEDFWEGARSYDNFVTFNGRSFTMPFLYHRSAINKLRPTVDIARDRYLIRQSLPYHVDLLDEFTFYGAVQKRPSLAVLCNAYEVDLQSSVKGEDIAELFQQNRFRDIAKHSSSDVMAIKSLYEKWRDYLAPQVFINASEI